MYRFITRSKAFQIALFAVLFVIVAAAGFYMGIRHEGGEMPLLPHSALETYTSAAMGISFEYPTALGAVFEEVYEKGECPAEVTSPSDRCEHRYIGFMRGGEMHWFLSGESSLYMLNPQPREGRYEDTARIDDIEKDCGKSLSTIACTESINSNGLRVLKVTYMPACNGFESCGDQTFSVYYLWTGEKQYPVIATWYDHAISEPIPDAAIDQIVDSIRPTSTNP